MPQDNKVLCTHCSKYLPRKREREHRKLVNAPYLLPLPKLPSRLHRVINADSDSDNGDTTASGIEGYEAGPSESQTRESVQSDYGGRRVDTSGIDLGQGNRDSLCGDKSSAFGDAGNVLRERWTRTVEGERYRSDSDSDSDPEGEPPSPRLEGSDDESDDGYIDWTAIEAGSGLSNWDQLGENYEKGAAEMGTSFQTQLSFHF